MPRTRRSRRRSGRATQTISFSSRVCNRKHLQKYSESRALHKSSSTLFTPTGPSRTSRVSRSIFDSRKKYNVPIFLGESGENTDEWVKRFRLALERHEVGWAFWTYKRMDTHASMRTFNRPAYWDELTTYQQRQSDPFAKPREPRPSLVHARAALDGLLRNARFENTRENIGYVEALGMHPRGGP